MPTLLLDGTLTAVTPIAIILPASEDNRTPAGAPRKRMLRDGVMEETVYVPPSSLRGRLRHLLTSEMMRLQHDADGRVFTPHDYIDTALGGVMDRKAEGEDARKIDLKAIRELRQRNPIVSMFGSMVSRVQGRLVVGDMTPVEPVAPTSTGRSVRANPFVRNPAIIELLDATRFDEFLKLNDLRTKANRDEDEAKRLKIRLGGRKRAGADTAEVATLEAEIVELERAAKEGFEAAGGAVNIQQLLDGYDVVPEGTVMTNRIRLIEGTDAELALVLLSLDLLARRPFIGGHTAHGCGEIAGAWRARIQTADALMEAGTLRLEPFAGLQVESGNPALVEALRKATDFGQTELLAFDFSAG
jgi:CRISPR/Cas system CSM-associated protein Csm3 (group 7 of RAMP superfamily)